MISKQKCLFYFVGEQAFKNLADAQIVDLQRLMPTGDTFPHAQVGKWLMENKAEIIDILSTTPTSRLKGRKLHGATRKKKVKVIGSEPAKPVPSTGTNRQP